jgi:exonuclease SbcC
MIPIKLFLRNFMSYGEPGEELDFDFHTACLCGDNGNGKSALLDAMTWALWGRAPRLEGTQAKNEEIIRRANGVNEALVEFQFGVDGDRYRVVRRLRRGRSATLELYLYAPLAATDAPGSGAPAAPETSPAESWRPLTGATNTDTQRALQSLLGLDYHTFITSSFLFQGRADSFTRAAPTERKEVLGRILRLDLYDELARRARDLSRECEGRARQLGDERARLQAQADCEPQLAQQAAETDAALRQAEQAVALSEGELEQARLRKAAADSAAKELRRAEAALKQAAAHADSLAQQEAEFSQRVQRQRAALAQEQAIRAAAAQLEEARRAEEDLNARREQATQAQSACQQAAVAVKAERVRLEAELRQIEASAAEARKAAGEAEALAREAADLEGEIRACQEAEAALESSRHEMQRIRSQQAADDQAMKVLRAELADIAARITALTRASARCPLCEQHLAEDLRRRLLEQAQALASARESAIADLKRAGEEARLLLGQFEAKMRSIQPHVARGGAFQKRLGEVQQRHGDARTAAANADTRERQARELRHTLEAESFALEERRKLAEAEAMLARIAYDPGEHKRVQETIRSLAGAERKLGAVESARASLPQDEEHLAQVHKSLAAAREALAAAARDREHLRQQAADVSPAAAVVAQAEARRADAQKARDHLVAQGAALSAQIESCRRARDEAQRCGRKRGQAELDRVIYGELAEAFGRQGVQALVIETVVPQLTEDANELLGRMTEGRMQVNFVTQRERPDGGAAETLDIHISDEMGTRRYELYSGGEAFRVDFAVRVALARLLARRAGAKLQTLVIDEGFGTQDAASRDKLVECINAIQQDFEKVLVITHIDELKDAFQERIEVTKDERGSHLRRQISPVPSPVERATGGSASLTTGGQAAP